MSSAAMFAVGAELAVAGVVHQKGDAVIRGEDVLDTNDAGLRRHIRVYRVDLAAVRQRQLRGKRFQAFHTPGNEHEVVSPGGETLGIDGADTGRGAGHKGDGFWRRHGCPLLFNDHSISQG
ncbi:MAG: hypothetical protein WDN03_08000 [Rhizomicrobium sp.]